MKRFNLGDRQSSSVLASTDSLAEMIDIARSILDDDGPEGFEGLSLSIRDDISGRIQSYDDDQVLQALTALQPANTPVPLVTPRRRDAPIARTGF